MNIIIKDDTIGGKTKHQMNIKMEVQTCTLQDLIRERVYKEVETYNTQLPEYFNTLVQPTNAEVTLNGYKLKKNRQVDAEKQYYLALDAFKKNGFFVLVNDEQVETLETQVQLSDNMELSFIKLTPLVGG